MWKTVNQIFHWGMWGGMIMMAGAAAVASHGSATTFFNILGGFASHIGEWFTSIPAGLTAAKVATGNLVGNAAWTAVDPTMMAAAAKAHTAHDVVAAGNITASAAPATDFAAAAGHGAHAAVSAADQMAQFDQWVSAMSPEQLATTASDAKDIYGQSLSEYFMANHFNHAPN